MQTKAAGLEDSITKRDNAILGRITRLMKDGINDEEEIRRNVMEWSQRFEQPPAAKYVEGLVKSAIKRATKIKEGNPIALARTFALTLGGDIARYRGDYYLWTGRAWEPAEDKIVEGRLYKWIETRGGKVESNRGTVTNIMGALAGVHQLEHTGEPPFWLEAQDGDPPPATLMPFQNGVLDLNANALLPPDRRLFTLSRIACDYDPAATAPGWAAFLGQIFPDDQQSADTLEEMFGYILMDDTSAQKAFLCVGPSRSGKSTTARVAQIALGPGRTCNPTLSQFSEEFGRQSLIGRAAAFVTDSRGVNRFNPHGAVESILSITGEDLQTVRRKNKEDWHGRLPTRLVIMTNAAPALKDATGVVASRFIALLFGQSFYGREDPELTGKLVAELPGIVNRWLAAYRRLKERGYFVQPESGKELLEQMMEQASPISRFVEERCMVGPECKVVARDLYAEYSDWLKNNGHHIASAETFGKDLYSLNLGITNAKVRDDGTRERYYKGIGLAASTADNRQGPEPAYLSEIPF